MDGDVPLSALALQKIRAVINLMERRNVLRGLPKLVPPWASIVVLLSKGSSCSAVAQICNRCLQRTKSLKTASGFEIQGLRLIVLNLNCRCTVITLLGHYRKPRSALWKPYLRSDTMMWIRFVLYHLKREV